MDIQNIGFKSIYTNKTQTNKPNEKDMNMSDKIGSFIQSIKDAADYKEVCEILKKSTDNKDVEQLDPVTYRMGDYYIKDKLKFYADNSSPIYKKLTEKGISITPQYVDSIDSGDYTIFITKIDGSNGKDLIPYNQGYATLSDEAKQEAYKDVQKLLKVGLVNNAMLSSTASWFITPESKKIIIPDWTSLRPVNEGENIQILNTFHQMIFRQ